MVFTLYVALFIQSVKSWYPCTWTIKLLSYKYSISLSNIVIFFTEPKQPIYFLKDFDEFFSFMYRVYRNILIFDILFDSEKRYI